MRMWMVNPRIMCDQHLLGEHVELHMFVGSINKGLSMDGYLNGNLLEPMSLFDRHAALVKEMYDRGMNHKSPLPLVNIFRLPMVKIDRRAAEKDLLARCPACRARAAEEQELIESMAWT